MFPRFVMARRNQTRTSRVGKIEPSELTFYIPTDPVGGGTPSITQFADLSQIACLANRRFYRQGLNWAVAGIKVLSQSGFVGAVTVSKLPNSWVMANSWKKSMATWTKMNNDALANSESLRPRFLDFKLYADADHHTAGYGQNMIGANSGGIFNVGEWESSKILVPKAVDNTLPVPSETMMEYEVIATGANYPGLGASGLDAVSAIEGYAASRLLPAVVDPNAPADAGDAVGQHPQNWMTAVFNEGITQDSDVIDVLIDENNIAPYPFENDGVNVDTMYPGGANQAPGLMIHDVAFITTNTIGGHTRIKGGNFPCGLMRFDMVNTGSSSNLILQIDLIPGSHRGYLAEPMQDM